MHCWAGPATVKPKTRQKPAALLPGRYPWRESLDLSCITWTTTDLCSGILLLEQAAVLMGTQNHGISWGTVVWDLILLFLAPFLGCGLLVDPALQQPWQIQDCPSCASLSSDSTVCRESWCRGEEGECATCHLEPLARAVFGPHC